MLQTLYNLGPAPEPNLTILWDKSLPSGFKDFASKVSVDTSAIQFENDELIRTKWGDDSAIACCVSPMRVGKQMQFFGARVNVAKALLYAINGGKDELSGEQIGPKMSAVKGTEPLQYKDIWGKYKAFLMWLAHTYITALNCIHYSYDKYAYESIEMAFHDLNVLRTMACGIAGLSVATDSLSAIKYAKVTPIFDDRGIVVDYDVKGKFPTFGNDDDRADKIASKITKTFMKYLKAEKTYRNAVPTQSILTITSNVVYGKNTGNTPDGRRKGAPFAPGSNPMNGRDTHGMLTSAMSVAKIKYDDSLDGISLTSSIMPNSLGKNTQEKVKSLSGILDVYTNKGGYHMNVNVLDPEMLKDAMKHPEKYPSLTIRVSGYAVNFVKLTEEQQKDVLSRTFHLKV
jgi:formate C-acetyltransferase